MTCALKSELPVRLPVMSTHEPPALVDWYTELEDATYTVIQFNGSTTRSTTVPPGNAVGVDASAPTAFVRT